MGKPQGEKETGPSQGKQTEKDPSIVQKHYVVIALVGSGSHGTVHKVRRIADSLICAMKECTVMHMSQEERDDAVKQIQLLTTVRHQNVIKYYDGFVEGDKLYTFMEYCERGDLAKLIRNRAQLFDEARVWSYFIQILRGLVALHSNQLIHRDIKSANVMLIDNNSIKIGDLGVPKLLKRSMYTTQIGTPHYMAPEIWKKEPYTFSSDMWALGCVLYELAALSIPFRGLTLFDLRAKLLQGECPPIPAHFSSGLTTVLKHLLNTDQALRLSAKEVLTLTTSLQGAHDHLPLRSVHLHAPERVKTALEKFKITTVDDGIGNAKSDQVSDLRNQVSLRDEVLVLRDDAVEQCHTDTLVLHFYVALAVIYRAIQMISIRDILKRVLAGVEETALSSSLGVNEGAGEAVCHQRWEQTGVEIVSNKNTEEKKDDREIDVQCPVWAKNCRPIGNIFVSDEVIGLGNSGTRVFRGYLKDGRQVAVKKMLVHNFKQAEKEIGALIASDEHPCVLRYFAEERDMEFVYLALEFCTCSLSELILCATGKVHGDEGVLKVIEMKGLWENGREQPSEILICLLRNIVEGLRHLHSKGIVQRDLKPHNILIIISEGNMIAKIADMGISKQLDGISTSFSVSGGSGSRGWRAPEQIQHEKQTSKVDLFSLGLVLFFCVTGGQHPFGDEINREVRILRGESDLFILSHLPEAQDLISALVQIKQEDRPRIGDVLAHPFFWVPAKWLRFLNMTSDRLQAEEKLKNSTLAKDFQALSRNLFKKKSWAHYIDPGFLWDVNRRRRYSYNNVIDLLRLMRNKCHHFDELPNNIKEAISPLPNGYVGYFKKKFPGLCMGVYRIVKEHWKEDQDFLTFFQPSSA